MLAIEELLVFGRAFQGRRRGIAFDRGRDRIEVSRTYLALVFHRRKALFRGGEFLSVFDKRQLDAPQSR